MLRSRHDQQFIPGPDPKPFFDHDPRASHSVVLHLRRLPSFLSILYNFYLNMIM
jgi:hypothetical protein